MGHLASDLTRADAAAGSFSGGGTRPDGQCEDRNQDGGDDEVHADEGEPLGCRDAMTGQRRREGNDREENAGGDPGRR